MRLLLVLLFSVSPLAAETGADIVKAARKQVGVTVCYDPAYAALAYPDGDVPRDRGVCTDVLIRALREGADADLQKLVHEDMKANFRAYPKNWGLTRTDRNIDHRRVPNLRTYLKRRGFAVRLTDPPDYSKFRPGDIVTCTVAGNLPHVMIVSDRKAADGTPLVIHNIGAGAREENVLKTYPLTGHYRWKAAE
ncbi:MAG: DUF1287 domain-containing protein [Akkermansiaceae bacterium]|nr:DUF1287 domain-containing protein [Akkermansiaceae bacterium]